MHIQTIPGAAAALAVHGGAGSRPTPLTAEAERDYHAGLAAALNAGSAILAAGGSALDATCAAVLELEDNPLFNSAHGAALTARGAAELDAAVMCGNGDAGAVAACTSVRNPILAARAVMERTGHVLLVAPPDDLLAEWGLDVVSNEYFVTARRREELVRVRDLGEVGSRHGTVGAVARDASGRLAAATSTGGMTNQMAGRVGDTPLIGAGTFASDRTAAISCTGHGEYFIRGAVAHDIHARMAYRGDSLAAAIRGTIADQLDATGGSGGLIAVGADGELVLAFNSASMFRGYWAAGETHVDV